MRQRPKNQLLASIPEAAFARLAPDLVTIPLAQRHNFYNAGDRIDHVYFPNGGVVSITTAMADGTMVETATVGKEGMVGIEVLLGPDASSPGNIMLQVPDSSVERLSAAALRREVARDVQLAELFGRYSQTVIAQMMQSAACNALHQLHERCARWLLMTHDRMGRDEFELSHEFLASMLGVRRSSVTVVAGGLQAAGVITYRHARLSILDRAGLEEASCECYGLIRDRYQALQVA
jgi:CRP-like cAMP-binding protein